MSGKYSKRKIENMLRETSMTLSPEADGRICEKLGIADEAKSANMTCAVNAAESEGANRGSVGRRIPFNYSAVIAVAAVLCAVVLAVWIRSLRKEPVIESGEEGQVGTTVTVTPTNAEPTSAPTIGPDEIRIDEKNFPDPTFREIVARNWDNNQNGALDAEEISGIVYVHVNNYEGHELKSLKGIEYFTELGWLICYKTDITELDVSKNVKLCSLECTEGKLMKLDLSANTELTAIDVRSNKLTELDLSANKKLTRLDCSGNKISSLNLSANTELTELLCSSNPLNGLDVTKCKKLTRLTCFACGLETIDLSDNTELTTLNIGENKLTALDLSNNGKLVDVDCYLNSIDTLTFRSCASLQHLSCEENKLTSLDVSGLAGLNYFFCANNQLSELDVSGNPDLAVLACFNNMIRKLDVSGNTKLEELLCWNCGMSELILGEHSVLLNVDARDNNLTELDASGCPETEDITVDDDVTLIRTKGGQ